MSVRYVSRRFTHRDSRAHVSLTYWTWYDASAIFQANTGGLYAAFRPCNFYHKFWHRFFASRHARFSRLPFSLSSLPRAAARKIVEVLRFSTRVIRRAICRHDLLIGPTDQYFTNRSFFKISELHVLYLHIQACTRRRYFHNPSAVTFRVESQKQAKDILVQSSRVFRSYVFSHFTY